jgi:hypothetical protein
MDTPRYKIPHYGSIHRWIYRNFGKASVCEVCNKTTKTYHWANLSGKYLLDRKDWKQMCVSCHKYHDFSESARRNLSLGHSKNTNGIVSVQHGLVARYETLLDASTKTGISRTAINNCLMGRAKTSGGRTWRYI